MPPRYKSNVVATTKMLGNEVCRIVLETEESVDLPTFCETFTEGEAVRIELDNNASSADCVMNGMVYDQTDMFVFISCGGLLVKIKRNGRTMMMGSEVAVGVSKVRRRRRST
tara:strand:- start:138 stop:473 length:336 start_codon:yes stop_codon:yes gene_type:complete